MKRNTLIVRIAIVLLAALALAEGWSMARPARAPAPTPATNAQ